jgi:hypothetical protein
VSSDGQERDSKERDGDGQEWRGGSVTNRRGGPEEERREVEVMDRNGCGCMCA